MVNYIISYLRLSLDDGGDGESNSIENQRRIIENYITANPDFIGIPTKEFADDGYTGTNFNRPGFNKLLEMVRRGEVACIIVKDLSRFGRKYLEVSKYLEQFFPYLGIRFIAVNDHYDSNNHKGITAEMDVPVRNLINEYYSKQVSKKVKDAKRVQIRQGKFINAFTRYGYKKDPKDKHRVIIDEPAAEVVRRIFNLACIGQKPMQIANILNADGVQSPLEYRKRNGSKIKIKGAISASWTGQGVIPILRDEQYTGVLIYGKFEMGELGTGKLIRKPKEEWIRVPGAIPAIITPEIWKTSVSMRIKRGGTQRKPNAGRILFKRVRCGYCNHVMSYAQEAIYFCKATRKEYCCVSTKYSEHRIVDVVKTVVQKLLVIMLNMERLCKEGKKVVQQKIESSFNKTIMLKNEIAQMQALKRQLYEQYKGGILKKADYFKEREAIEVGIIEMIKECEALSSKNDFEEVAYNHVHEFFNSFSAYQTDAEPTADIVNALVESVYVFDKDRIEVRFSFIDELEYFLVTT
ncbi:MAG: recombinase family protein [Defluviitaleaceae bacterium]|nr:recombinase family protein [Defluviitaleaceae bacterium]